MGTMAKFSQGDEPGEVLQAEEKTQTRMVPLSPKGASVSKWWWGNPLS